MKPTFMARAHIITSTYIVFWRREPAAQWYTPLERAAKTTEIIHPTRLAQFMENDQVELFGRSASHQSQSAH
jgi:hypothetical protein